MANKSCFFCNCKNNPKEVILFENKTCIVRLDQTPVTPGHMEVLPKDHYLFLADVPKSVWLDMHEAIKASQKIIGTITLKQHYEKLLKNPEAPEFVKFVQKALESPYLDKVPDAFTVGINDGEAAGRSVHHLHIHVIPRYWGDIEKPRGGIRAIFGDGSY